MADREEIVAGNEGVVRRINEAIERGRWPGEGATAFRCECAVRGCSELIDLTHDEYERVRADGRYFVIVPGHDQPDAEDVIERHEHYVVVRKRGQAGAVAEANDPRR